MERLNKILHMQRSFRAVMNAFSQPGRVFRMAQNDQNSSTLMTASAYHDTLVKMFVDQAVNFSVQGEKCQEIEQAIAEQTHASAAPLQETTFIVVKDSDSEAVSESIAQAYQGTLLSPETGATVLLACKALAQKNDSDVLTPSATLPFCVSVAGPGVEQVNRFGVSSADWLWARNNREDEFPCGIEIVLVDEQGYVVAIPRSSFASLLAMKGDDL